MLGFEDSYEVCNCKNVSIEQIILALKDKEEPTLRDIQDMTTAGTECRHCIFQECDNGKLKKKVYCKDILNEIKRKRT